MDAGTEDVLNRLRDINEYAFERFVADLWEQFGWKTEVTAGSQDRGVDIIAEKSYPVSQKHIIQAKRWGKGNKVGGPAIREYSSLQYQEEEVDVVIVVTTSSYTQQARKAASNLSVKLVDGKDIHELLIKAEAGDLLQQYSDESESEVVTCTNCDETFSTSAALEEHQISEHRVKCELCSEPFRNKTTLKGHIESEHIGCPYCSELFQTESSIREHLHDAHDQDELSRIDRRRVDQYLNSQNSG